MKVLGTTGLWIYDYYNEEFSSSGWQIIVAAEDSISGLILAEKYLIEHGIPVKGLTDYTGDMPGGVLMQPKLSTEIA